jgi:hypothetical protein
MRCSEKVKGNVDSSFDFPLSSHSKHTTDNRNISLFSPCPVMPPRKAGVPKQQHQRGPSISTTAAPTKHITSSSSAKYEKSSHTNTTSNKENNNKAAPSTMSH